MTGLGAFSNDRKEGNMANIYGYIRVSSRDQNEDRQVLSFVAENERRNIRQRQAADACGVPVGTFYGKARKFENSV